MLTQFFEIPLHDQAAKQRLNQFLASHRVLNIRHEFVQDGMNSLWAVCVIYARADQAADGRTATAKSRVDYREELPEEQFRLFAKLREARNERAAADGVAPYNVFNNEHLAQMIRQDVRSLADLRTIAGVGDARLKKYGQEFIDLLVSLRAEGNGQQQSPLVESAQPKSADGRSTTS